MKTNICESIKSYLVEIITFIFFFEVILKGIRRKHTKKNYCFLLLQKMKIYISVKNYDDEV